MENTLVGRILEAFADDLFRYLLPRRINVMDCRAKEKWDNVPRVFSKEFGMSVLCESRRKQKVYFTYYAAMFPAFVESIEAYMIFCASYSDTLSDLHKNDVFQSMRAVASMILELGVFCHLKGYKNFKYYAPLCWAEFFKIFMKQACPTGYDWSQLKELSQDDAKTYMEGNYEVTLDQNRLEVHNEWLRTYDTWASVYPALYVMPQSSDLTEEHATGSEPASENEPPPQETFKDAIFAKPADVSELQKKADDEKKVQIVNTSSAIAEKYKRSPQKLKLENEYVPRIQVIDQELLDKFRLRLNSEKDSASQQLSEIMQSEAKTSILMNDEVFLQVITQKTNRRSRKKMKMDDILELAKLVLSGNDRLAKVLVKTVHHVGRTKKAKESARKEEAASGEAKKMSPSPKKPWKETGAIPKARKGGAKSHDQQPPRKIYNELMQQFKTCCKDSAYSVAAGLEINRIFASEASADLLLRDEVFREVMALTINYPTNRWSNEWLLSIAKSLIQYDLSDDPQSPADPRLSMDQLLSTLYNIVLTNKDKFSEKRGDSGDTDKSKESPSVDFDLL